VELFEADMTIPGAYDEAFRGTSCVFHAAAEMGNLPGSTPMKVYEGGRAAIVPVMDSVKKSGTVKRFIFTSSFAAVGHPKPSRPYTEDSWAYFSSSDDHTPHKQWTMDVVRSNRDIAYAMTKVHTEQYCYEEGAKSNGQFDCVGLMPWTVVGPILCAKHNIQYAWQSMVGDIANGFSHRDMDFNIVDVRDVAEAQCRIAESAAVTNGDRYNLVCHSNEGFLSLPEVKRVLQVGRARRCMTT
jgi:nucleoside-diphosphate-sugar epimerase